MALTVAAVQQFTRGRLDSEDDETQRLLDAALFAARRWCGWHVSPVRTDTVTLDGRGGRMLRLPTMRLDLTADLVIVENGVTLSIAHLDVSKIGMVEKTGSGVCWTNRFGGIVVTMTHGYAEALDDDLDVDPNDTAPDFEAAVLSLVARESLAPSGGRTKAVGPFQYDLDPLGTGVFTLGEQAKLEQFRLERPA